MQKLFDFVQHIGRWRVLVQSRDLSAGAVTTEKIADGAVTLSKLDAYLQGIVGKPIVTVKELPDASEETSRQLFVVPQDEYMATNKKYITLKGKGVYFRNGRTVRLNYKGVAKGWQYSEHWDETSGESKTGDVWLTDVIYPIYDDESLIADQYTMMECTGRTEGIPTWKEVEGRFGDVYTDQESGEDYVLVASGWELVSEQELHDVYFWEEIGSASVDVQIIERKLQELLEWKAQMEVENHDGKIDTIKEIEDLVEDIPEGTRMGFADNSDINNLFE